MLSRITSKLSANLLSFSKRGFHTNPHVPEDGDIVIAAADISSGYLAVLSLENCLKYYEDVKSKNEKRDLSNLKLGLAAGATSTLAICSTSYLAKAKTLPFGFFIIPSTVLAYNCFKFGLDTVAKSIDDVVESQTNRGNQDKPEEPIKQRVVYDLSKLDSPPRAR